jgi:hypothetical protein
MEFAHLAAKRPRVDCSEGPTRQEGNAEHTEKLNPELDLVLADMTMPRHVENHVVGFLVIYHGRQNTMACKSIWGDRATSSDRKPTEKSMSRCLFSPVSLFPAPRHGSGRHGITVSSQTYVALADDRPRLFALCYASMVSLIALFTVWGYRHQTMLTLP